MALAVGLAETFPTYGARVGIKWPNDILYKGRKLGGILAEHARGHLLVGVGVNVNNRVPEDLLPRLKAGTSRGFTWWCSRVWRAVWI